MCLLTVNGVYTGFLDDINILPDVCMASKEIITHHEQKNGLVHTEPHIAMADSAAGQIWL